MWPAVYRKNVDNTHGGNALYVRGSSIVKGKSQERARSKSKSLERARSKSKSCRSLKDMECYNCGKKGHLKKDYRFENKDKETKQDKGKK